MVNIYQKKYGNGSQLEPNLFSKTKEILNGAVDKGLSQSQYNPNDAFRDALRHNANVFSAFRVHKMQSDIASQLLDKDGNLKPFGKFVKDVKPYVSHQNRAWLQTEYDTAVLRAHQAADWQRFEAEKDVLPNLEWIPSTSPDQGADHRPFWNTVLPIDHKFWKIHRPGDRWNCKCQLRNTDKPATQEPGGVIDKSTQPAPGLETNPGEKGEVFSNKHPYFPENCGQCPFNKGIGKLFAALVAKKGDCSKCKKVNEVCEEKEKARIIAQRQKEYNRYYNNPDYLDVQFNEETGALKATHRGHAMHQNDRKRYFEGLTGDEIENKFLDLCFNNGHSIVFCDESKKDKSGNVITSLDMYLNGVRMDLKTITKNNKIGYGSSLLSKNSQLKKFNKRTDIKEKADTVCLFFYDPNFFGEKKIMNGIKMLKKKAYEIQLKHIVCVLNIGKGRIKIFSYDIEKN